jgi:hypothetical protein
MVVVVGAAVVVAAQANVFVKVPAKQLRTPLAVYPVLQVGVHDAPELIVAVQSPFVPFVGTASSFPPVQLNHSIKSIIIL